MKTGWRWGGIVGGCLLLMTQGCTVRQQQQVLGTIGQVIPGSSNSLFTSNSSSSETSESRTAAATPPTPPIDLERVQAQLVLRTLQRAMSDNPAPFQECLDNSECKPALATYLIRLQRQAMGTLELPPVYDRYDLKRGKE